MKKEPKTPTEAHPIANLFPRLGETELEELAESILRSGQRDDIVMHEGKILDGRNTLDACILAGVEPRFRDYDPEAEGPPIRYVLDKNLERRHLTPSQRAAVASAALAFIDGAASVTVGDIATSAGVSRRTATDALAAAKAGKAPEVIAGKTSASGAAKKARAAEHPKPKKEKPGDDDDAELRAEHEGAMKKTHGDQFARAFANGSILKGKKEIKAFLALDPPAQKDLTEYLAKGWTVAASVKFHNREITPDDDIESLILRAVAGGKDTFSTVVAGYVVTVKRQK